jgi:phosphomethylpyrimidine synthase
MFTKSFLKGIAKKELVSPSFLEKKLSCGEIVILYNKKRRLQNPVALGSGLRVKINTNVGLSPVECRISKELKKLSIAIESGADTVMDLSVSENAGVFRRKALSRVSVPLGTVPIYEAALRAESKYGSFEKMGFDDFLEVIREQAADGVDFFTVHAGILSKTLAGLQQEKRIGGIVSRGGAILARWMAANRKENFLYENFDSILGLAKEYRITLSLGDALRPGAIADSSDSAQFSELRVLGELIKRCRKKGVQAMVEGPGHIRLDEIPMNMLLEKKLCHRAPFYVLGPLPTDIACGYDHITSAIGGAIASLFGADFLCVVTPAEHLRHPTADDIKEGTIASKISAHCVNVLRFEKDWEKDLRISRYRAHRQWEKLFSLAIDEKKARQFRKGLSSSDTACSMCGKYCSLKLIEECNLI